MIANDVAWPAARVAANGAIVKVTPGDVVVVGATVVGGTVVVGVVVAGVVVGGVVVARIVVGGAGVVAGVVVGGVVVGGEVVAGDGVTDSRAERRAVVGPAFATMKKDWSPTGVAVEVYTTKIRRPGDVPDRTCAETPGARPTAVIENDEGERPPTASTS